MVDVVVFGSCMVDFISYVDRLPKPGETLHSSLFETGFGGKGANQCVAVARLGDQETKVAMIGKLGNDPYGIKYKQHFEDEGIDTKFLEFAGDHTGVALIEVSADGENTIVINANANKFLSIEDCDKSKELMENAKILICQFETPIEATVQALKNFRGFSILNGAPAMLVGDDVLKLPNIFCVNEAESEELTGVKINGIGDVKQSINELVRKGCRMVVITIGKLGAAFNDESGKIIHVPVPSPIAVADTVGAGDAFIAALAFYILRFPNASWVQKIGSSVEIASHSVQFKGTQSSYINFPNINPETKRYDFHELC